MAQGFSCIFWGLLGAILAGTQLVLASKLVPLVEAGLGAGVLAVVAGSWRLAQVRLTALPAGGSWRGRADWLLVAAGLLAYFCVLFYLWRRAPENPYLLANACLFVLALAGYVIVFAHAAAGLGDALGQPTLAAEAWWFNWSNIGLLALLLGFGGFVWLVAQWRGLPVPLVLALLLGRLDPRGVLVLLLPFSLTLSVAWGAKNTALELLLARDPATNQPEP